MGFSLAATAIFFGGVFVVVMGVVLISGFLPPSVRPQKWWSLPHKLLVGLDLALILLLVAALVLAAGRLQWSAAVISGGLAILAAPLGFQALPRHLRNESTGLLAYLLVGSAGLAILASA
jgi:hypothetical protein